VGIGGNNRLNLEIQSVARSADPPIRVEVESQDAVLAVRIPPQSAKPYSFGGRFFLRHGASLQHIIQGKVQREERPELPMDAVREALFNAVAHRDYRSSASVHAYLFKDRLEVVSPGGLPAGMTEADLGTKSVPRNRLLFRLLHRMDPVEEIGSGIRRIRELCREHGVAGPTIETSEHWVTTTFLRPDPEAEGPHPTRRKSEHRGRLVAGSAPSEAPSSDAS